MLFCSIDKCNQPNFSKDTNTGKGFCRMHQSKRSDYDRRTILQKAMDKQKTLETKIRGINNPTTDKDIILRLWYMAKHKEMVGYCTECSGSTFKNNPEKYKWSIAHICPKGLVPSVATHYHNWIELCWQCHSDFDSTFDKAKNMKCFHEAKTKFQHFKHLIPNEELRKVNPHLI